MTEATTTASAAPQSETVEDVAKRVQQYVAVRDRLKEIEDEHQKRRQPLLEIQNLLAGLLQEALQKAGANSIATPSGTCYETTQHSATVADPEAFMQFVIENKAWELLDRKANKTAVRDYATEHAGRLPPGVNLSSIKTVGVRRSRS